MIIGLYITYKEMGGLYKIGQWVLYRQIPAYVLKADDAEGKFLIQVPTISRQTYWVPSEQLEEHETVELREEDIQELKAVAVKSGDFQWYRELTEQLQ